ncbi:MAG TPA: MOSC domain-containing protein [Solirubrobacteraceae bacterium]|jgi:hypothetical protein
MVTVRGLNITPVKGTQLQKVTELRMDRDGVRENRRFYLIDDQNEMVNSLRLGALHTAAFGYSDEERRLRVELPDGRVVDEPVALGAPVQTRFYGSDLEARLVDGPWSEVLSELADRPLRLVEAGETSAVDRRDVGAVSLISRGSLDRLAAEGGLDGIDARRFRMLIEVDGVDAHAEDAWVGSTVRVGEALVGFEGHAGRCNITTRNPVTGEVDAPTLKLLGRYRQDIESTEPLPFGIYGRVVEPGFVCVGDPVALEG